MHSTKQWDFSHPKNKLGDDRDYVTYHIMGFVQDHSQLIEYCGIVCFYVIVCNLFAIRLLFKFFY